MQNRILPRLLAPVVVAGLLLAARAFGYVVYTDDSGVYVIKWQSSPITMQVMLSSTANLQDGSSQRSSVATAMQFWNTKLGTVQFSPQLSSPGAYHAGNGTNEIVMDSTLDGDTFPAGALAITLIYSQGDSATEDDIVFNNHYTWNSYRGNLQTGKEDIRRVALHELGHVLGLDHPDEYGQNVTALMNSRESNLDTLQADDIAGAQFLYGPPGVAQANNNFANAALISLTDNYASLSGSNIGASREAGEPDHAGATIGHSVWWKWTPTYGGSVLVDTFGSNFDTVLAVYTGSSVSSLTEVASNDDAETTEENPSASRLRTSKVAVDVVGGTTYYVAVDGWGKLDRGDSGYTGSITLNLNFTPRIPPSFTEQPTDNDLWAGGNVYNTAQATGFPTPNLHWQRRPAGTDAWSDVINGGIYSAWDWNGEATLQFTALYSMDGDTFRCVATNTGGTATSDVVALHVRPIPLPVITTQPRDITLTADVAGGPAVEADGATDYQWFRDGVALAGQTDPQLVFADPEAADTGVYYVVVSNPGGSVTSNSTTVTVAPLPAVTNLSPTRQVVALGQTLSLDVSATGSGMLTSQWYHDGRAIAGATSLSYSRTIASADGGAYWVAVTDDRGTRYGPPFFVTIAHAGTDVVTWGRPTYSGSPSTGLTNAVALSAGTDGALILNQDGTVVPWGQSAVIQGVAADASDIVATAVGYSVALLLKADGTVTASGAASDVPTGLKNVAAIACGDQFAVALKTNGTVVQWGNSGLPTDVTDIAGVAAADNRVVACKRDGSVEVWSNWIGEEPSAPPAGLDQVVQVAAGRGFFLALKADGSVVAWGENSSATGLPMGLGHVVSVVTFGLHTLALRSNGTVVAWGDPVLGETDVPGGLESVFAIGAGGFGSFAIRDTKSNQPPLITEQPASVMLSPYAGSLYLTVRATGAQSSTYQWQRNGADVPGATASIFSAYPVQPSDTGLYSAIATSGATSTESETAIVGFYSDQKVIGAGDELQPINIRHPNGNVFDQVLLTGLAESITADAGQITRTSFIDLNDDIVQVEFTGAGTLSLVLEDSSGPAPPVNYSQAVNYMNGHAGIVIAGANETTNVSVFTVGRATAFDPTGAYNILLAPSATNNPANNGSPLFAGHAATHYDGVADIAFIAILSGDGKFGGVRAANAHFFATKGLTGIYAPDVEFVGPVYLGNVEAFDEATPVIRLGSASDVRITGGDLSQDPSTNGRAVQVSGIAQLKFTAGSDSGGYVLPAQQNKAVLEENGVDVTSQIVVNPP